MAQVLINFRTDSKTKAKMKALCDELGLSISTALNMFIKEAIREQRLPLSLQALDNDDGFYSEKNQKVLRESTLQLERGEVVEMTFDEFEKMIDE